MLIPSASRPLLTCVCDSLSRLLEYALDNEDGHRRTLLCLMKEVPFHSVDVVPEALDTVIGQDYSSRVIKSEVVVWRGCSRIGSRGDCDGCGPALYLTRW